MKIEHKGKLNTTTAKALVKKYCIDKSLDQIGDDEMEIITYHNEERISSTLKFNSTNIEVIDGGLNIDPLLSDIKNLAYPAYILGLFFENLNHINPKYVYNSTVTQKDENLILLDYSNNERNFIVSIQLANTKVKISVQDKDDVILDPNIARRIQEDLNDVEKVINDKLENPLT